MKPIGKIIEGRELFSVESTASVLDAVKLMAEKKIGALPVLSGGEMVGVFSERDLMTRVIVAGRDPGATPVADVMTLDPIVADVGESYDECLRRMQQASCRHLPVVSEKGLVGMISLRDLLIVELDTKEDHIRYLDAYLHDEPPPPASTPSK
ncbi:MAG: CBS domain-containing protein [Deltaproteobacteria bacterium]|nr:MAG: CBS domain-containing protein [Deltaproteobacteria bacterium]